MNLPERIAANDIAHLDALEAQALDAIEHVTDPKSAEGLLRRIRAVDEARRAAKVFGDREQAWRALRLRAERRWGELAGPAENRGPATVTSGDGSPASREALRKARMVAAVPEPDFAAYVEQESQPTRAGLLRAADKLAPLMSSQTDMWATPQDLFDQLNAEFNFDLDVCATADNAKCPAFYDADVDGLSQPWTGTCWMNPPYGEVIGTWVGRARLSAEAGATVVCLVPARVDTNWWWGNCRHGEIRFLRGRLKFGGAETSAPFPSAVVIFRPAGEPKVVWWER